jgi:glycosyltransferase involved in cell wall biosynthesis
MIYSSAALYAIKLKRRLGIPLLFTHHGCMRFENLLRDSIVKMYDRVMIPGILSEADGVIALSQEDLEFLGEFGDRNNITIIPNGLDTETIEMSLLQSNNASHDTYKFQKNILFVGRLVPIKGTEYLLKSIKIISQDLRNYGVRIIIIGDGPQLLELKQFVFNNKIDDLVTFTGQITETQKLIDYYQKSQIIVIPSISEGFPSTVLEAMYFGVPIISTDLLVMRQYFSDAVILVPPKDPERLGNAILTLVQNPDFCEKLSKIGKETVLNEFRWDKLIYRFLAEYDILLSKSSNTMHYSFKM